ncbi:hypothetical protein BDV06DRAFT_182504 [Aspergillus oleicola]
MGVSWNRNLNSGSMRGFLPNPYAVDESNVRSDAARAYYVPIEERENLHLLLNTSVTKVVWDQKDGESDLVAAGVEFDSHGDMITTRRGLSAGNMRSSKLLELSGVKNPRSKSLELFSHTEQFDKHSILKKHDIPVKLDIHSIGENLQD